MLNTFELPKWFEAPPHIRDELIRLWNKPYYQLYEDEERFVKDKTTLIKWELEDGLLKLIGLYEEKDGEDSFKTLMYFNWILCLSVKPNIDGSLKNRLGYESYEFMLNDLVSWSRGYQLSDTFSDCLLSAKDMGVVAEAVAVYENMQKIPKREQVIDLIADSIDCCLQGSGIAHGTVDKRAIFNWLLIHVFPSAYCHRLPDFIYTIHFDIENWNYSKFEE